MTMWVSSFKNLDFREATDYIPIAFPSWGRSREALPEEGRVRRPLFVVRSHGYREASGNRPRALRRAAVPSMGASFLAMAGMEIGSAERNVGMEGLGSTVLSLSKRRRL